MKITKGAVIAEPGSTIKNKTGVWRTMKPVVDRDKCEGDGTCWMFCPDNAITIKNKKAVIDYNFCKGCLICMEVCPLKAIRGEKEEK